MVQLPPIPGWSSLHPLIVHFPIALFLLLPLLLVAAAMSRKTTNHAFLVAAFVVMALATGSLCVAYLTGDGMAAALEDAPTVSGQIVGKYRASERICNSFRGSGLGEIERRRIPTGPECIRLPAFFRATLGASRYSKGVLSHQVKSRGSTRSVKEFMQVPSTAPPQKHEPLLDVRELMVQYRSQHRPPVVALRGVSLAASAGEIIGVLGESGSGKSTLALALCRLLPNAAQVQGGSIQFRGRDLLALTEAKMEDVRGAQISLLGQDPNQALNPVLRVGEQVAQVVRAHNRISAKHCRQRAREMLQHVGLGDARYYEAYPHQLSGGQKQRVVIAQALVCRPALLIADEPTSALDSITQSQILDLLQLLVEDLGTALLLISHDPNIVERIAHRTIVMYAGRIAESGRTANVFANPLHPYTVGLLRSRPTCNRLGKITLACIPGAPPDLSRCSIECSFEPRCDQRMPECSKNDPEECATLENGHSVRCFKYSG